MENKNRLIEALIKTGESYLDYRAKEANKIYPDEVRVARLGDNPPSFLTITTIFLVWLFCSIAIFMFWYANN